ncbi:MAG: glycosyltransferase family 39 protein [Candidatus Kerfeldbacteria bacterium]|nr:glycosyltransferase family 39 protein [Candidatus Kerfeldbacteria bacterium]
MRIRNWLRRHAFEMALLAVVVVVGSLLRLVDVGPSMHFGTDEGRDAFVVNQLVTGESIPLLGPAAPNNRPDFHLGAFFYYLLAPGYLVSNSSPTAGAVTIAIFSSLSIIFIYAIGRALWDWRAGLAAAALYSTSFLMVYYGRWAWNPNVVPFFMLVIMWCAIQIIQKKMQPVAWHLYVLGIAVGAIIQLHGTALLVVPVMLGILGVYYRPRFRWWQYFLGLLLVAAMNLPTIIYDITNRLANARGFIRVMTQSDSPHTLSIGQRLDRLYHLVENFFQDCLTHGVPSRWWQSLLVILVLGIGVHTVRAWKSPQQKERLIIMTLWFLVPLLIFAQYQEAIPTHYFAILFPVPFLFVGWLMYVVGKHRLAQLVCGSIVIFLCFVQAWFSVQLVHDLAPTGSRASSYPLRLDEMQAAVQLITDDANGVSFTVQSYPLGSYDRSFSYLFMRAGIAPSVVSAGLDYRIVVSPQYPIDQWSAFGDVQSAWQSGPLRVLRVAPPTD